MTRPQPQVIVLGGGPAGAAAARLLAGWGYAVTLLTRPPHHQPLVESLPPSTVKLLDRIGLREAVDRAGFLRATGNTAWWGPGEARVEYFETGLTGFQVPRARFDQLLLDQAASAGATVHRHAIVRKVNPLPGTENFRQVEYDADGATQVLTTRWVLDCTGRAGLTARHGWRCAEPGLRTTALVATWEQDNWPVPDISHTLVESYGDGWAWSVPESSTRRQVAVMVDPSLAPLAGAAGLLARYRTELGRTSRLQAILESARLIGSPWARDASPYSAATTGEPGLLLVGDAASFTDPLSSFGVKKALASGWLAAVVTRTALDNPEMTAAALTFHHRRESAMADALRRRAAEFSREATEVHPGEYWARRLADADASTDAEPDTAALREDPDVASAFQELKRREQLAVRPAPGLRREQRPAIHDDRIVMEEQLILPAFPAGIRWLRGVDLVQLVNLAPAAEGVPQLFEAITRPNMELPLPDFLGALSVLLAKGALEFA
ncbi:MAG TPA: FAD-dependent monooxygenase [Gemmatimonadales bacterium]|nr:FAD-dependent monooxygenase [Gemmatimonadales bacterium]